MKKVLIATTVSGFVPQFEMNNVRILQSMGYEVHYASNFKNIIYGKDNHRLDGTEIVRHQIDFVRSPFAVRSNIKAYRQLKALFLREDFQLLHCHTPVAGVLARLAAAPYRKKGLKSIYTAHGFHFYKGAPLYHWLLFYPVERLLARVTDVIITINQEDFKCATCFCRRIKNKVEHIPGVGVAVGKNKKTSDSEETAEEIKNRFGVSTEDILLVSAGELNTNKNQEVILRAISKCNKRICCILLGEGSNREYLEGLIKDMNLENKVFMPGYQDNVQNFLRAADVFILASRREGLPCSIMEAMVAGLPVIASDTRGNRELIVQGRGGYLFRSDSWKELLDILNNLNKGDFAALGQYNKKSILHYSCENVNEKMRRIYTEVSDDF